MTNNPETLLKQKLSPRMFQSEPMQRCKLHKCEGACCLFGVWADSEEKQIILNHQNAIIPHLDPENQDPEFWFDDRTDIDPHSKTGIVHHTAVYPAPSHYGETVCVFFRKEDYKCALQVASEAIGQHPWALKPFYCILHPLDLDDQGRITVDETELLVNEKGSCLRKAPQATSLIEIFQEEIEYLLDVNLEDYLKKDDI